MMPENPIRDMMQRTMANLKFVESHATQEGPFEVTQLVNSFLAALAHPWEKYKQQLNEIPLQEAFNDGWPMLTKELMADIDPRSLGDQLRLVRHAFAHGNIEFKSSGGNEITHLRICNINPGDRKRTWGTIVSVDDMHAFLEKFVKLATELTEKEIKNIANGVSA